MHIGREANHFGLKTLPPIILDFFARFLPLWDGSGPQNVIVDILSYVPVLDFKGEELDMCG